MSSTTTKQQYKQPIVAHRQKNSLPESNADSTQELLQSDLSGLYFTKKGTIPAPNSSPPACPTYLCIEVGAYLLIGMRVNIWGTAEQLRYGVD
ncbi:hypothetical protein JWH17_17595 [Desulfobulbus marinus]|nr:hypothetical protein [Desulfogranum marinum]